MQMRAQLIFIARVFRSSGARASQESSVSPSFFLSKHASRSFRPLSNPFDPRLLPISQKTKIKSQQIILKINYWQN